MCQHRYFHGTSADRLASIAQYGLLPIEQVSATGYAPIHPDYSRPGVVYVTADICSAETWAGWSTELCDHQARTAVLCVNRRKHSRKDSNLWQQRGRLCEVEIDGAISPRYIFVHDSVSGNCKPIREYVS